MTYSFKEETISSSSKKGVASHETNGGGGEVETVVKKNQVVKTSTTGHQDKKPSASGGDKVDSSLNNVVLDIGNQMIPDCIDLLSNKKDKTKKSVRLAEGDQSSNQQVTSGSSSQFYSYSSSSSSSNKKQVVTSSSVSSTTAGDSMVDYSRINSKQMSAAAGALTQKQLDSPVCNFPVFAFIATVLSSIPITFDRDYYFIRIIKIFPSTMLGLFPNLPGYCVMFRRIHNPCVI